MAFAFGSNLRSGRRHQRRGCDRLTSTRRRKRLGHEHQQSLLRRLSELGCDLVWRGTQNLRKLGVVLEARQTLRRPTCALVRHLQLTDELWESMSEWSEASESVLRGVVASRLK
ncbi:MAG: hypothetical protein R3B07_02220 [Polyangiaceae bacterium]